MDLGSLLVLLIVLACPLMMVWMMRGHGGHGHGSHGPAHDHVHSGVSPSPDGSTLDELRHRRAELDADIARLEDAEAERCEPSASV